MGDATSTGRHEGHVRVVTAVDAHVAGNVLRLATGGLGAPCGQTMAERARWLQRHEAEACAALTREPRGHDAITLGVLCEAGAGADAALVFRTSGGFVPFSGCGLLAASAIALDRSLLVPRDPDHVRLETGAGVLDVAIDRSGAPLAGGMRLRYVSPPAFVLAGGVPVAVGSKSVRVDIAWAGQFLAFVDSESAGLPMIHTHHAEFRRAARVLASAIAASITLAHPTAAGSEALAGIVFTGPASRDAQLRALSVTAAGVPARAPTTEAVTGIIAVLDAMGVDAGEPVMVEGLAGTPLTGRRVTRTRVGELDAVQVEIAATAWIIGEHRFFLPTEDPLRDGFDW